MDAVFIGDEISAAGWRLAGLQCHVPPPTSAEVTALFQRVRDEAGLVLITAELAEQLSQRLLDEALRTQSPPTLVIADIRGRRQPADLAASLKRQLGLAE
ncbi:Vacuolar H+transporting two-sector ATPase F subunit [Thiohalocapsa marina]|uniref:Vacuolar H+transporting two-sector ATPase F subunit n=1 Tax=Thiohalocapsa marina TaxID=424902 RepID=A0A5M8FPB4_9GAMM|nr:V-type ATP synthase subunit F [Thiohalocapsa marina]KAA6184951.1 Vacuolar H+transporting two-sector ATPase F subunit [Thiohalocapsa marina]